MKILVLCFMLFPWMVSAHVGTPYVVFEGKAGQTLVRAVVRQPDVVPGLAEINVRILEGSVSTVMVRPLHWNTGIKGAPRPDVARLVPGETNLFTAELWLMSRGAYGVEVTLTGERGGTLVVPVNSVAFIRKPMNFGLGAVMVLLGTFLALGLVWIAVAAVRESTLPASATISPRRRLISWVGGIAGVGVVLGAIYGGRLWWQVEEETHLSRVLFHPLEHALSLDESSGTPRLMLDLTDSRMTNRAYGLIPDHGKLLHLFLIGDGPTPAFAHVHPVRDSGQSFQAFLPPLAGGTYRAFVDLTHESGLTETLTNSITLPSSPSPSANRLDEDDSWSVSVPVDKIQVELGSGLRMGLKVEGLPKSEHPLILQASLTTEDGNPVALEPFLRMLGHAVIMRSDGQVFAHVHPSGTLSMAAARKFAQKNGGEVAAQAAEVVCGDLGALSQADVSALASQGTVRFPFVFPSAGDFFVWIQAKVSGRILTGAFRVKIS